MLATSLTTLVIEAILFAMAAGLVYGLFGGGSGLFLMPGFYLLLRHFSGSQIHPMQIAVATTAATTGALGIFPVYVQSKLKHIDYSIVKKCFMGILCGTVLAVLLLNVLPSALLKRLFGIIVIGVAIWMWGYVPANDHKSWSLAGAHKFVMTCVIGLLWFLLGIAVFTVPYLQKCRIDMRSAVGSATLISTIFSAVAALLLMCTGAIHLGVSHTHIGFVNLPLFAIAIIPSAVAAFVGAKISVKLPQKHLKKVYAVLIGVIGILMLA